MYSIVIFYEDGKEVCEGVPSSWIFKVMNKSYCFWPPTNNVSILIKKLAEPSTSWNAVPCTVKSSVLSYEKMIISRKKAERFTTDVSSEEEEHCEISVKSNIVHEIVTSHSSDDENSTSKPAKKTRKTFTFNGKCEAIGYYVYFKRCLISNNNFNFSLQM